MRLGLLLAVALGLGAADSPPADAAAKERKLLEGTWTVEKATLDGKALSDAGAKFVFAGNRLTVLAGKTKETVTYAVDPSRKLRTMRFRPDDPKSNSALGNGIYELKGDTLRLCLAPPDGEPDGFTDRGQVLFILKRKR